MFVLALTSGAAVGAGWLDESLGALSLVGIAGFITLHLRYQFKLRWHFLLAWLYGSVAFAIATFWVPGSAGYLLATGYVWNVPIGIVVWMYLGLQHAIIGVLLAATGLRTRWAWLCLPAVWLGILTWFPNMFPFLPACLLTGYEPMLQLAELGGVYLVSIYALAIGGFLAWSFGGVLAFCTQGTISGKHFWWGCFIAAALVAVYGWGDVRMKSFERQYQDSNEPKLKVGLVQASTKYDISHQRMVDAANAMSGLVELVVWPENSLGNYSTELTNFSDAEHVRANSDGELTDFQPWPDPSTPLLAGADIWQPGPNGKAIKRYVSALFIDKNQELTGYRHKIKLMPFGEFIPGRTLIPKLHDWFGQGLPISTGTENKPLVKFKHVTIGSLLCCEDMFPSVAAELVHAGSNLLVTIGNNIVFDSIVVGRQHFRIARFRAIENRTPMLRCMTTGVSGLVAPSGRVIKTLPENEDGAGVISVPILPPQKTLFTRWRHGIPLLMMFLAVLAAVTPSLRHNNGQVD